MDSATSTADTPLIIILLGVNACGCMYSEVGVGVNVKDALTWV
jgi:hypothetical protein